MQVLTLKAAGLYSFPNPLGTVPPGSLLLAQNAVIDRPDTVETRRGQQQYGIPVTPSFQQMYNFNHTLMAWDGTNIWYDSNGAGTWIALGGSYLQPTGTYRIHGVEASSNFYFATSTGIYGLTAPNSTLYSAGVPFPLDSKYMLNAVGGAWFATANTVGYRMTLSYTDVNNNLHVSAPSQRLVISNETGGDVTVTLTWYIPPNLPLGYNYSIWRTRQVADISGISQDPGDEEYLVVNKILTAADISNRFITYTDSTPDVLLGTALYTNPSQQTIAGANYQPPLAKDITFYQGNMLYANTTTKQQAIINMIATGSPGDTITIGGVVYTAGSSEVPSTGTYQVFTSGTTGQNIDNTARSLVHVINTYTSNTFYWAIYTSDYTTLPGNITLQERGIGGASFSITASAGTNWSPQIPLTGTSYSSSNNINKNYVYVSKVQIPEAVPLGNYIPIGTADKAILRIIAQRDSVFVFKEDGIYRILGTDITNFTVSLFDPTVILTVQDSVVALNNQVWAMTNQGVVSVSDSGSIIQSRAIERDLITLSSAIYPHFPSASFGIGYESDRHYVLCTPTNTGDTIATQMWVYNFLTQCWTNWPLTVTAGIVSIQPDDHLYLMQPLFPLYPTVTRERKDWTNFDFADLSFNVDILSFSGLFVTLNSTLNIEVGYTLYQADSMGNFVGQSIITQIVSDHIVKVTDLIQWDIFGAGIYQPINWNIIYTPISGNVAWVQHFMDAIFFFRPDSSFSELNVYFSSDFDSSAYQTTLIPIMGGGFGTVPFGLEPFGGLITFAPAIRTLAPRQVGRCHWLNTGVQHAEALTNVAITGINFFYNYVSSRFR
jgi:hypothetical protein